jgi:hypothetical protein
VKNKLLHDVYIYIHTSSLRVASYAAILLLISNVIETKLYIFLVSLLSKFSTLKSVQKKINKQTNRIATTITYPLQVMKSRLQQRSQTAEMNAIGEVEIVKRQYKGVIDVATKIWKMEGLYGFFKGCVPNAIRVAPSAAITFVVYESIVDMMSNDV